MRLGDKVYTRDQILQRVGNAAQIGGTRHYILNEGRSKGVAAVDVDTGAGLRFTVLPDRGMDISCASYKGTNLVFLTPNGEVNPSFYEPQGLEWLRTFFGGLLTTCGLTYFGSPGEDDGEDLGLHGRHTTTPARQVVDLSGWRGDEYVVEVSGTVEDAVVFGDRIRLTRTISTTIGSRFLTIRDVAENFGYRTSPFTILYHINPGFPLLDESAELLLGADKSEPCDKQSVQGMDKMFSFSAPVKDFPEENFLHTMTADDEGFAHAAMINRELHGGLGLYVRFRADTLPYLNEWKMTGQGDYVVGIEPCNAPCENRAVLRERGLLPVLEPGETREMSLEIGVVEGEQEIDAFIQRVEDAGRM